MPSIEWQHNRKRLLLPVVVLPGYNAVNGTDAIRTQGLLDTGATSTGIRTDIASELGLRPKANDGSTPPTG